MEQIIMDMKTAESEKFAELQNEAEKRGYDLSADAEKMVKAMIKREKKLGGIYCPCRNIVLMEDEEKKNYTCPCVDLDIDIKETGACHCGVFVKKKEGIQE
jgi:ferredoxin-thioredoxin reductase catalytic subunit